MALPYPSPPSDASRGEPVLPKLIANLLPHLPDVLTLHDPMGTYRLVSPRMRAITGWAPSELLGRNPYDWVHPEDRASTHRRYHQAMLMGASVQGRFRYRHKNGHYVWLDFTGSPVRDDPDDPKRITALVTLSRDVTNEMEAAHLAQEHGRHLEMTQQLAGLAWWTLDLRSSELRYNEAFVEMTGQAGSAIAGARGLRRLVHPQDRPSLLHQWQRLRRQAAGQTVSAELRLMVPGGGTRWVRVTLGLQSLVNPASHLKHPRLQGVMLDISEVVQSRETTHRWMRQQDHQRAQERLEVAHELHDEVGQVLTGLRWHMESLRCQGASTRTGKGTQARAVKIDSETLGQWMQHLDEANATLRRVAHRLRPPMLALGLHTAITQLSQDFARRWLPEAQLVLQLDPSLPDGDEWRVQTVLGILRECLNNAARHAQARTVRVRANTLPDGRLRLLVSDDGVGMDLPGAPAHERMGLASLRERAQQLNATLTLHSQPGAGTRVQLLTHLRSTNETDA